MTKINERETKMRLHSIEERIKYLKSDPKLGIEAQEELTNKNKEAKAVLSTLEQVLKESENTLQYLSKEKINYEGQSQFKNTVNNYKSMIGRLDELKKYAISICSQDIPTYLKAPVSEMNSYIVSPSPTNHYPMHNADAVNFNNNQGSLENICENWRKACTSYLPVNPTIGLSSTIPEKDKTNFYLTHYVKK